MRKLPTTSILNHDELAILANGIHQLVGESVTLAIEAYGLDLEANTTLYAGCRKMPYRARPERLVAEGRGARTEGASVSAEGYRGESRRVSGSSRADPVHRIT